ncbi:hypothetical protein [Actinoplanes sp. GCM10030250]|uniref:hypothetical protein n=1 Tax=Actinoplanes sp. GCM10030250 TaxID=3273376 RepID=UPI003609F0D0
MRDDELRAALRAEADSHRPDREAMLDRITTAAMSTGGEPQRAARRGPSGGGSRVMPGGSRVRMAAAAAAVVAVFAGGGVANWALAGSNDHKDETAPAPSPAVSVTTTTPSASPATPASSATTKPSAGSPAPKPATTKPAPAKPATTKPSPAVSRGNTRVEQGPLWSDGSVDEGGDASVVTLKTTERLTRLEVVIRVARTEGLTSRGGTKQTPGASVTTSVTEEAGALLYRFVMSSADTLGPGTYTFTAKYTHGPGGRDAGGDTYEAVATAEGDVALDVYGNFFQG